MDSAPFRSVEGSNFLKGSHSHDAEIESYASTNPDSTALSYLWQGHYSIILQLLQHGDTDVNQAHQGVCIPSSFLVLCLKALKILTDPDSFSSCCAQVDKFDWPPMLEACSRRCRRRFENSFSVQCFHFLGLMLGQHPF